jgi:hypothetical protein
MKKYFPIFIFNVLLFSCATKKLATVLADKFPNGMERIYVINQWVLTNENTLCKTIADSVRK